MDRTKQIEAMVNAVERAEKARLERSRSPAYRKAIERHDDKARSQNAPSHKRTRSA